MTVSPFSPFCHKYYKNLASETSGISTLDMTEKARVSVYDLAGNKVAEMSDATAGQAVVGLAKGMYIIKTVSANGIKTGKVQIK